MSFSRIFVDNSTSWVEDMTMEQYRALKKVLVYTPEARPGYRSFPQPLIDKKGYFPTGLLGRALSVLKNTQVTDNRRIPRPKDKLFTLSLPFPLYPHQKAIVEASRAHRGIISSVTGSGKSAAIAALIERLQVRTLIVVPNLQLKQQLTSDFLKYFGKLDNITIENIDSRKLLHTQNYDCLIIDEAHHSAAKTYRDLNKKVWNKIFYRFYFTATPFRSQKNEQILLESVAGKVIYEFGYKDAVKSGVVVPIEAYFIEITRTKVLGKIWQQVYSELVVNHSERNVLIANLLQTLHSQKVSTLCLVKEIAHGNTLHKLTGGAFASGENEETTQLIQAFNEKKLHALIGTTGVLGEGIDTKPCEFVVIAGLGRSKNAFMQQVGRAVRKYPGKETAKVILIKDTSHKWTRNHFNEQCKILKEEYGCIPVKLVI